MGNLNTYDESQLNRRRKRSFFYWKGEERRRRGNFLFKKY
jgi:hypothetical protein